MEAALDYLDLHSLGPVELEEGELRQTTWSVLRVFEDEPIQVVHLPNPFGPSGQTIARAAGSASRTTAKTAMASRRLRRARSQAARRGNTR